MSVRKVDYEELHGISSSIRSNEALMKEFEMKKRESQQLINLRLEGKEAF